MNNQPKKTWFQKLQDLLGGYQPPREPDPAIDRRSMAEMYLDSVIIEEQAKIFSRQFKE